MQNRCHNFWREENNYSSFLNDNDQQKSSTLEIEILKRVDTPSLGVEEIPIRDFSFVGHDVDWKSIEDENRELGKSGEDLVIEHEKYELTKLGRVDLADQVVKVEDGCGYDILSWHSDDTAKYIEVKTTINDSNKPFPITINEIEFSRKHSNQYYLYRLFSFEKDKRPIKFYEFRGNLDTHFLFEPILFRGWRKSL